MYPYAEVALGLFGETGIVHIGENAFAVLLIACCTRDIEGDVNEE